MSAAWPWAQLCAHSLWGSSGPLPLSGLGVLIWRSVGLVLTQPAVLASQSCLPGTRATGCQPAPQPPWPHCSRSSAECASREKPCWAPRTHALWVPVSVGVVGESPGVSPRRLGSQLPSPVNLPERASSPRHPASSRSAGLWLPLESTPPATPVFPQRGPEASRPAPMVRRPSESSQAPCSGAGLGHAVQPRHAAPPAALPCAPSAEQAASPLHP